MTSFQIQLPAILQTSNNSGLFVIVIIAFIKGIIQIAYFFQDSPIPAILNVRSIEKCSNAQKCEVKFEINESVTNDQVF